MSFAVILAVTAGLATAGALALADEGEGGNDEGEDEEDADELSGSPGEATSVALTAPCWMSYTGTLGREVVVGVLHGQVLSDGTRVPLAVAYFDNERCHWGDLVATDVTADFVARLTSWYSMDRTKSVGADVDLTFEMWKHANNTNCSAGTPTYLGAKTGGTPVAGGWGTTQVEWYDDDRVGIGHYFTLAPPTSGTSDSYEYLLTSDVTSGGTTTSRTDSGCFRVSRP